MEKEWKYLTTGIAGFVVLLALVLSVFGSEMKIAVMLLLMILLGVLNRVPAKLSRMRGLELWLPFTIIVGFAAGPFAGMLVGVSILFISDRILPDFPPAMLLAMLVTAGIAFFAGSIPVTQGNLLFFGMLLSVSYNLVTNSIFVFWGQDMFRMLRFTVLSLFVNYLVYQNFGYMLFSLLQV